MFSGAAMNIREWASNSNNLWIFYLLKTELWIVARVLGIIWNLMRDRLPLSKPSPSSLQHVSTAPNSMLEQLFSKFSWRACPQTSLESSCFTFKICFVHTAVQHTYTLNFASAIIYNIEFWPPFSKSLDPPLTLAIYASANSSQCYCPQIPEPSLSNLDD